METKFQKDLSDLQEQLVNKTEEFLHFKINNHLDPIQKTQICLQKRIDLLEQKIAACKKKLKKLQNVSLLGLITIIFTIYYRQRH